MALLLIACLCSKAQPASVLLDQYTTGRGLANNTVWAITKTRYGYTWLGTQDGLCRFDGHSFITFRYIPGDSTSISNNTVYRLLEDADGYLWAGTFDGLNRYNPATGRFDKVSKGAYIDKTKDRIGIGALAEEIPGHRLWVGSRGLYYINKQTLALEPASGRMNEELFRANGDIISLLTESPERIWIGSNKGLILYNGRTGAYQVYTTPQAKSLPAGQDHFISKMKFDKKGKMWITTLGAGLMEFDTAKRQYINQYLLEPGDGFKGGTNRIFDMAATDFPGQEDILWLVADRPGLTAFNTATRTFISYSSDRPDSRSGVYKNGYCLYFHPEDGLWIGGIKGLYRYDRRLQVYTTHDFNYSFPNGCISEVFDAYADPADATGNTLWIATWGCGIYKYNLQTKKLEELPVWIKKSLGPPGVSSYFCVLRDRQGMLWAGSSDDGLLKIDETQKEVTYLQPQTSKGGFVRTVTHLIEDEEGRLWAGTTAGLFVLGTDRKTFTEIKFDVPDETGKMISPYIGGICLDRNGNTWFTCEGRYKEKLPAAGMVKKGSAKATMYYHTGAAGSFPDAGTAGNLLCDDNNEVWCASWNGLIHWNAGAAKPSFAVMTTADGLLNNFIYAVQKDPAGNIWCGTLGGLSAREARTKRIKNYNNAGIDKDNIENFFYNPQQQCFIIGDLGRIHVFRPEASAGAINPPPVVITDFRVFGKPAPEVSNKVFDQSRVTLAYNRNVVTFDFAALTFYNSSQVRYAYRMEGVDKDWLYTSGSSVTYNLNNGHYVFRVKAMNAEGLWNEEGTYMEITIRAPWWKRTWFILLAALAAAALLNALYQYRIRQLKKMHSIRDNISRDLHDDIGASLSNINILNELAKRNAGDPEKAKAYLDKSGEDIQRISESLSDIVWNINPRYDELANLFIRMKRYAADMMDGSNISYRIEFPETTDKVVLTMEKRRDMFLLFKEAVNNLVKYSAAKNALLQITLDGKRLFMLVKDDGKGFDRSSILTGNGLHNMEQRAAALDGQLQISSAPGTGTEIRFEMKT